MKMIPLIKMAPSNVRGDVFGIPNVGSTCWLSSLLQVLLSSSRFRNTISTLPSVSNTRVENVSPSVSALLKQLPESIFPIFSAIQRRLLDHGQQDVDEGVHLLLDILHDENAREFPEPPGGYTEVQKQLLRFSRNKVSPIFFLFQGISYWTDSDKLVRYEPFLTTILSTEKYIPPQGQSATIDIQNLIGDSFGSRKILTSPVVMVFCVEHLSRNFSNIDFRLCHSFSVQLRPDKQIHYELRGVALHSGVGGFTTSFGHYTAIRTSTDGAWFMCDDHNIAPIHGTPFTVRQVPRLLVYDYVD